MRIGIFVFLLIPALLVLSGCQQSSQPVTTTTTAETTTTTEIITTTSTTIGTTTTTTAATITLPITTTSTTTTTTLAGPPVFTFTPFVASSEVYYQGGYSPSHNGIDVGANQNASFRAVCNGTFTKQKFQNDITGRWQVNTTIVYNATYSIGYKFESFGGVSDESVANTQYDLLIASGTSVVPGDSLGQLYFVGSGAHVHFDITPYDDPMNYFTGEALTQMRQFTNESY
jgi:hypothetical protein